MGAASAKSAASWCEGGNEGPKGGIAVVGGRGIMTGAEPNAGNASPPAVWWRGLCGGGGPELGSVGSVATGCTAADMDRSTPPNSTGRHPPEPGPLLTAGRIPPPPGSGAYGKYSSSINRRGVSRGNDPVSAADAPRHHDGCLPLSIGRRSYSHDIHFPLFTNASISHFRPRSRISRGSARARDRLLHRSLYRSIVQSSFVISSPSSPIGDRSSRASRFPHLRPSAWRREREHDLPAFVSFLRLSPLCIAAYQCLRGASLVKRPRLSGLLVNNEFPLRERGETGARNLVRRSPSTKKKLPPFPKCVSRRWTSSEVVAPTRTAGERNDRLLFFEEKNNCRPKEEEDALEAGNRTGLESSSSSELGPSGLEASSALVASLSRCDGSPRRLSYCPRAPVYLDHNLSYSPCFQWRHFFLA